MTNTTKVISIAAILFAGTTFNASAWTIGSVVNNTQISPSLVLNSARVDSLRVMGKLNVNGLGAGNEFSFTSNPRWNVTTNIVNNQAFGSDVISNVNVNVGDALGETKISNMALGSTADISSASNPCMLGNCGGAYGVKIINNQGFINPTPRVIDPRADTNVKIELQKGAFSLTNVAANNTLNATAPGGTAHISSVQRAGAITNSLAKVNIALATSNVDVSSVALGNSLRISTAPSKP